MILPFRPALLVGLGPFGLRVLHQVTQQARHVYGQGQMVGLGIDLSEQPLLSLPAEIGFRSLHADLGAWIRSDAILQPHLSWFDAPRHRREYRAGRVIPAEHPADRQIARLALFHHLQTSRGLVQDLRTRLHQLQGGSKPLVYLVAALGDGAGTLVLDTATLLRRIADYENIDGLRIAAYLATPEAFQQPEQTQIDERSNAQTFAALREIRRFAQHPPHGYLLNYIAEGDPILNGYVGKVFETIQVYCHPPGQTADPQAELAALAADTFLAQLDAQFGEQVAQYDDENLSNAITLRQHEREKQKLPPELFVSLRQANTAVFPRDALARSWQSRLGVDALRWWLGVGVERDTIGNLLYDWSTGRAAQYDPVDHQAALSPAVIGRVLEWYFLDDAHKSALAAELSARPSHVMERWVLDAKERESLAVDTQQILQWLPSKDITLYSVDVLRRDVPREMERRYGSLLNNAPRDGLYQRTLAPFVEGRIRRAADSLRALAAYTLNQPGLGLLGLGTALDMLADALRLAQKALAGALQIRYDMGARSFQDIPRYLRDTGMSVERLFRPIPLMGEKHDPKLITFLQGADAINEQFRAEVLLALLHLEVTRLQQIVTMWLQGLAAWRRILLDDGHSLWRQVSAGLVLTPQPENDGRLWLMDDQWADTRYFSTVYTGESGSPLMNVMQQLNWTIGVGENGAPLIQAIAGSRPLSLLTREGWADDNRATWEEAIASALNVEAWNVWSYLLAQDARYSSPARIIPALARSRTQDGMRVSVYQTWRSFLLKPRLDTAPGTHDEIVRQIAAGLARTLANSAITVETVYDDTRFSFVLMGDQIPLSDLEPYTQWETAYRRLMRQAETLHIFKAEQNAVFYERERVRLLNHEAKPLRDEVVRLLDNQAFLKAFVWAQALGFIGKDDKTGQTIIVIPDYEKPGSRFRRNLGKVNSDWVSLLETFNHMAADGAANSPDGLCVEWVWDAIPFEMQKDIERWQTDGTATPNTEVWLAAEALANSTFHEEARSEAFAHDTIDAYYERTYEEWKGLPRTTSREVSDLYTVILCTARQERQDKHTSVRQMGT
ncbi:MAG TPA: tubulin-like doman-containing protein [Aggregatilineaceae bacterium]|nr:tubulin-like doman-containing protein [Aggregatilineaceae bacterium]